MAGEPGSADGEVQRVVPARRRVRDAGARGRVTVDAEGDRRTAGATGHRIGTDHREHVAREVLTLAQ